MDSRYLEPDIETAARATLRAVQEQRLHEQVEHAYRSSPFYRRKLDAAGVKPADVRSLDDLRDDVSRPARLPDEITKAFVRRGLRTVAIRGHLKRGWRRRS